VASLVCAIWSYPQTIRLIVIFGLLWLVVFAFPTQDLRLIALYPFSQVILVCAVTGHSLLERLSSARARLIPNFPRAQITAALGLCLLGAAVPGLIAGSRGLPLASLLLWLWSFGLLTLIACYAFRSLTWAFPPIGLMVTACWSVFGALLLLVLGPVNPVKGSMGPAAQTIVFIVNAALTVLFVKRAFTLTDEASEYFHSDRTPASPSFHDRNPRRGKAALDSLDAVLPADFRSRLRHLEMGLFPAQPSFLRMCGIITVLFVFWRVFAGTSGTHLFLGWASGQMLALFVAPGNVRRFFSLPLPRRRLVAEGGTVLLMAGLRLWSAAALAFFIANLGNALPMEWLLLSMVLQLPLFGMLTLALSVRTPWKLPLLLSAFVMGGWVMAVQSQVAIAGCLISGAVLIGLSYYRWCNAEVG
jgi:hypothetical protein